MSSRLDDGFSTIIGFYANKTACDADTTDTASDFSLFFEKEVTPPGMAGGGANDTSTMRNSIWRTKAPKGLITLSDASFTAAYDPEVLNEIVAGLNANKYIRIIFPNGNAWEFWGWLDEFTPGASVEGEQPTADCTIIPSNQDDAGAETAPIYLATAVGH